MFYGGWEIFELDTASCSPRRALHNALLFFVNGHDGQALSARKGRIFFSGKLEKLEERLVGETTVKEFGGKKKKTACF